MKAGLKALQNTSFSTFRGSEDGNPSPGAGLTAKQKKLLAKAERLEKAEKEQNQLDAVNAQNSSGSKQTGLFQYASSWILQAW